MIKKLQTRFTLITMLAITAIFILLFVSIFVIVSDQNERQTQRTLEHIVQNDGQPVQREEGASRQQAPLPGDMPPPGIRGLSNEELSRFTRFFLVRIDEAGNILSTDSNAVDFFTDEQISKYTAAAIGQDKPFGKIGDFQYVSQPKEYGQIIIFADKTMENNMQANFFAIVFFITCGAIALLYFVVRKLSAFAIKPVKEAFDRQKRFVSDASHELKTPISIIAANADVLTGDIGENKWLTNIHQQAERMNELIRQLLDLSKLDENAEGTALSKYSLSEEASNIFLSYESVAFEKEIDYSYHVEGGIHYTGDPEDLRKLLAIMLDNAFKYVNTDGKVDATVLQKGKKVQINIFNTGEGIDKAEQEKIFERFYRKDPSRSTKTGGHGLGLSIAQSITGRYGGKIFVESAPGEWVSFSVIL